MKKLLALALAMIMCLLAFAACTPVEDPVDTTTTAPEVDDGTTTTAPEDDGTTTTAPDDDDDQDPAYDLEAAAAYLDSLYKKMEAADKVTALDYTLVAQVMIGIDKYVVTWTVNTDKVTATAPAEDEFHWTIDVDEESAEELAYTITATITAPDNTTATVTYDRVVPVYNLTSFEDYMAATEGTNVVIKGIVLAMNGKSVGNTRNHLFLADLNGKGGYYCYQLDDDPVAAGVKVGMTVEVAASVTPYNGMQETKGGSFRIVDETIKTVDVIDFTDEFIAGDATVLKHNVGMIVTIKGVELGSQDLTGTSHYLYFSLNGKTGYVRSYATDFPTTLVENGAISTTAKATMDADHADHFGYKADVTGILILYSGNPYLIPISVTPFTNYEYVEKTAEEKVEAELDELKISTSITTDTIINLPLAGQFYDDVTFAWTVDNADFTIGEDGKVEIKLSANAVTLKFTVTATCGEVTETKEFTVNVAPNFVMSETHVYVPYINAAGTALYLDGGVDGRYLTTTTDASKAVAVYAEKADGGYKFYILDGETKLYITLYKNDENKDSVKYDAEGGNVFTYDPTVNAMVTMFGDLPYYLGTYINNKTGEPFTTISASKASYINAENTGVSQFPLELLAVATGVEYTGSVALPGDKVIYLTGAVDGRYLVTTENIEEAVAVYAEKVEGGYKFYILDGETKLYITLYKNDENKDSVKYDAEGNSIFEYDPTVNAWVTVFSELEYYLGTYINNKTGEPFTTISASKASYINSTNTGVSQFPLEYNLMPDTTDDGGDEGGEGDGDDTTTTAPTTDPVEPGDDTTTTAPTTDPVEPEYSEMTITEALAAAVGTKVIISGTVVTVDTPWNGSKITVTITDDNGNKIQAYQLATEVGKGDIIKITGTIGEYSSKKQINAGATAEITYDAPEVGAVEMTIAEALAATDGTSVIVTGWVKSIDTPWSSYNNMCVTITDGTNDLYIYRMNTQVGLGDTITVTGDMATYNGRQISAGSTATIDEVHSCSTWTEAACDALAKCTVCNKIKGEHSYSEGACDATSACACGAVKGQHAFVEGECACGEAEENSTPVVQPTTVKKTHEEIATIAGVTKGQNTGVIANKTIALDENVSIVCAKGGSTSDPCIYSESIRLYQNGATLTVKVAEGKTIQSIVLTLANNTDGQGPITVTGGTASALSGVTYTITADESVSEVKITTAGTSKTTRLYVAAIEVIYA